MLHPYTPLTPTPPLPHPPAHPGGLAASNPRTPAAVRPPARFAARLLVALLCPLVLAACQPGPSQLSRPRRPAVSPDAHTVAPPALAAVSREPRIRVRLLARAPAVTLDSHAALTIGPTNADHRLAQPRRFEPPVIVRRPRATAAAGRTAPSSPRGFLLTDARGRTVRWALPALRIVSAPGRSVNIDGVAYPGTVVVAPAQRDEDDSSSAERPIHHPARGRIDVINNVPLETYLPGVLEKELYPKWALQTYVAQAIVARSYAIAQQASHADRAYDVEATTHSQVYGGRASNPTARRAVRRTRGEVLAWRGRIVPGFFSSCSGGVGQSAAAAFPDERLIVDIAPLRGRTHGWGASSPHYRWGPITRDTTTLSRRIAAWGRAHDDPVAALGVLAGVRVSRRSPTGRPAAFRLTDGRGRSFILPAEWFRFACNEDSDAGDGAAARDLPPLSKEQRLLSSFVDVSVSGPAVRFTHGRGFGHGVGLDQWAAQEMAQRGHAGRDIAAFFFPGARIKRAY